MTVPQIPKENKLPEVPVTPLSSPVPATMVTDNTSNTYSAAQPDHKGRKLATFPGFLLAILIIGVGGVVIVFAVNGTSFRSSSAEDQQKPKPTEADKAVPTAKVVKPKLAATTSIMVEQLATVEPYYRADLRARASGIVKAVRGDIGDKVLSGDVLVTIDVPDSEQDVAQKKALIFQRQQELKVSQSKVNDTKAGREVSVATIKQREAEVQAAQATRDLRKQRLDRYKRLEATNTVVGSVILEEERDFLASDATLTAAKASVERARADLLESESRIEGAVADTSLKEAQIEVARKDLERAKVIAEFGKVLAPFDGVIVRRSVDPGSFVQNATTGTSETLISVSRVDIVTVVAKFPDSVAPQVAKNLPAIVQIDDLAGVTIPCKVTRFTPTIHDNDRTMRVEVDLFNGDEHEYARMVEMFSSADPIQRPKGINDPIPERAFPTSATAQRRLLPGMTGKLKLELGGQGESYVLPSAAVYSRGGTNYILVVENGKTRQLLVRMQLNDGKVARVSIVSKVNDTKGNTREVFVELTGKEQVVVARQLEYGDGTIVQTSLDTW